MNFGDEVTFTIRPFERVVDIGVDARPIKVSGQIRDGVFILGVGASEYEVPTAAVSVDASGPVAQIKEGDVELSHGFTLQVEVDSSFDPEVETEPLPPGCRIAVVRPNSRVDAELRRRGIDPDVNVIAPPDASFSVHFTDGGYLCGWAGSHGDAGNVSRTVH